MDDVLDLMKDVAESIITPRFGTLAAEDVQEKGPGDYVTIADRMAEEALVSGLNRLFPEAVIVGEEACFADPDLAAGLATAEHAFTIDPIDGTGNYVRGSKNHAVMIAELRRGTTVRSWIWQPQYQVSYVAEAGGGVLRNGVPVERTIRQGPARGLASRPKKLVEPLTSAGVELGISRFCVGVDYPLLVDGGVDFLVYHRVRPWDHLPGALMVAEIGGEVLQGAERSYRPDCPTDATLVAGASSDIARMIAGLLA